jgi:hypothetical protein
MNATQKWKVKIKQKTETKGRHEGTKSEKEKEKKNFTNLRDSVVEPGHEPYKKRKPQRQQPIIQKKKQLPHDTQKSKHHLFSTRISKKKIFRSRLLAMSFS